MIFGLRWKLFLLFCLGICLAMSTHAQESGFDNGPDLPTAGPLEAVVRSYEVQPDETGVIFRDGFEQPVIEDWGRDIISTALDVNVMAQSATATIVVRASASLAASFEIGDLEITGVRNESGPLAFKVNGGQLDVSLPSSETDPRIEVDYRYLHHDEFEGVMSNGSTMLWPYYCGNMFPCKSDPADGLTFELSLSNISAGGRSHILM